MTVSMRDRAPRGLRTTVIVLGAAVCVAWFAVVVGAVAVGLTRANQDTTGTSTAADVLLVAGPTAVVATALMALVAWWRRAQRVALTMAGTALAGVALVHVLLWWAGVSIAGY
jgi:hypothetical protein